MSPEATATPPRRTALLDRLMPLLETPDREVVRRNLAEALAELDAPALDELDRTLDAATDLEEREVRDVMGRAGERVALHRYRSCRAEDAESSWDFRPGSTPIRRLRDALLAALLGDSGLSIAGGERLARELRGRRCLFISNHAAVFDLAVLPLSLEASGMKGMADRLACFVNPKVFNTPFWGYFLVRPVGIIKVPQNPRIAAFESVMAPDEVRSRSRRGFEIAGQRLADGGSLVIYPEGLRSGGLLHRFARAYLDVLRPETLRQHGLTTDDVALVPWAHQGVAKLDELRVGTTGVSVRFGLPVDPARFFEVADRGPRGAAGHLAAFLVARLLPEAQRGIYGAEPEQYLDHPHFRLRIQPHTLDDIRAARELAADL